MFRPAIQKTRVLAGIAIFNILVFFIASKSTMTVEAQGHDQKIAAAELMQSAMSTLKESRMGSDAVFVDNENDPNETALIGPQYSLITTDEGDLDAKLTTLNPNFAALFVDLFLEAGCKPGDNVAVAVTGSMPGANLALYSAMSILELNPYIITSVGASQWGATDPYFTWLDMESVLIETGVFNFKSAAASIGGKGDTGKGVSLRGRELLWESIYRNDIALIQEANLLNSMDARLDYFSRNGELSDFKAYVNIGGGAASVGPSINARLIPTGVVQAEELRELSGRSVLSEFASAGVSIVHLQDIQDIVIANELAFAPVPLPEIGIGKLYSELKYNLWIAMIALLLTLGVTIYIGILSHRQIKHRMETYEPESIL